MAQKASEAMSKVKLGFSVVIFMAVLAVAAFVISAWAETGKGGVTFEDREPVGLLVSGDVEVRDALNEASQWSALPAAQSVESGVAFQTGSDGELGILFKGADLIRLYPDTELVFDEIDLTADPYQIKATLVEGSVWLSDLHEIADLYVRTLQVGVQPENAATHVAYDGDEVQIFSAHHPARVSFLGSQGEALNDYLLTEAHQVKIRESSLNPASIGSLRYTKLTKEYPFVFKDEDDWEDVWEGSLETDIERLDKGYSAFLSNLKRTGEVGSAPGTFGYSLSEGYKKVRSWLTFDKSYLMEVEESDDLDVLYQALYLIQHDRDSEALERLSRFQAVADQFESDKELEDLVTVFQAVEWGNEFYPVKTLLREVQLAASPDKTMVSLVFLRDRLNEIYDVLDLGERGNAKAALLEYNQEWQNLMNIAGSEMAEHIQNLTEERQILQNLLFREDTFYSSESYSVLSALEDRILNLTAQEYDLNEERQAFVQDKIRLLARLIALVDEGLVGVKAGGDMGLQLVTEAQTLMQAITTEVAVTGYFQERLDEFELKVAFIQSPEFILGEGSFDERYDSYLNKESDLDDLSSYVSGLGGDAPVEDINEVDALGEAETALRMAQVAFDSLELIQLPREDQDFRLYKIVGGHVALIEFEANYDRLTRLVYDLSVEGEAFSSGVKVENLLEAITKATSDEFTRFGEDTGELDEQVVQVQLTPVEKLAADLAQKNFNDADGDLEVELGDVTVVSLDENLFGMMTMTQSRSGEFMVDFVYNMESGEISQIVADKEGVSFVVEGIATTENMSMVIEEAWRLFEETLPVVSDEVEVVEEAIQ
jgi:hypothetical protein